jgi:hypothetical protein
MASVEMLKNANDIEFDSFRILQEQQQRRIRQAMRLYPNACGKSRSIKYAALPHKLGHTVFMLSGTALHWVLSSTGRVLAWTSAHRVLSRGA